MSLLMQALKRAEQAKKESTAAQEEIPAAGGLELTSDFPTLDPLFEAKPAESTNPVQVPKHATPHDETRIEPSLAEIDYPVRHDAPAAAAAVTAAEAEASAPTLEFTSNEPALEPKSTPSTASLEEQLSKQANNKPSSTLSLRDSIEPATLKVEPRSEPQPAAPDAENITQSQKMAQSILNAKKPAKSNRTLPILGTTLLLVLVCAGGVYYYWQTMQSDILPNLAQAQAEAKRRAVNVEPVGANQAASASAAAPVLAESSASAPSSNNDNFSSSDLANAIDQLKSKQRTDATSAATNETALKSARPSEQQTQVAAADQIKVNKGRIPASINVNLDHAYRLFSSGDAKAARPLYDSVLRNDPTNRDALLGVAAIELNENHPEQAAAIYSRLLDLDPNDPDAIAGLTSLQRGDPERSESQLKKVIAQSPQSGTSLFALGNLYMQQSRWSEAQEIYFRAFGTAPNNPDYAFNLAVSLDQLAQIKLALDYYQRALALAEHAPSNFNLEATKKRVVQLQHAVGQ